MANSQASSFPPSQFSLTKRQCAEALGLSLRTVDHLIASGQVPVRRIGRRVLIPYQAAEAFAQLGVSDWERPMSVSAHFCVETEQKQLRRYGQRLRHGRDDQDVENAGIQTDR